VKDVMNHNNCPYKNVIFKYRGGEFTERYCLRHKVGFCVCGYEWGKHPFPKFEPKDHCVSCGIDIAGNPKTGNYCPQCSSKAARIVSLKEKISFESRKLNKKGEEIDVVKWYKGKNGKTERFIIKERRQDILKKIDFYKREIDAIKKSLPHYTEIELSVGDYPIK